MLFLYLGIDKRLVRGLSSACRRTILCGGQQSIQSTSLRPNKPSRILIHAVLGPFWCVFGGFWWFGLSEFGRGIHQFFFRFRTDPLSIHQKSIFLTLSRCAIKVLWHVPFALGHESLGCFKWYCVTFQTLYVTKGRGM